jgi:uncharacterized protein
MKNILLLIIAFLLISSANAQNSKMDDIQKLMDQAGMDNLGNQMVNGYMSIYKNSYGENIPGLWDTLNVIINEGMGDLFDSIAQIYDNVYTHEEIKSMIEIYQTPIGKKMIETMPLVMELSMRAGQNWAMANEENIKERIAPLVEKYAKKEYTFEDFFNPDEQYAYDTPKIVVDSKANNTKTQGSADFKYTLNYDAKKWDVVPNETINEVADLTLMTKNQDVYAMIIAETTNLTIQQLKAAAIYNMSGAADNLNTESIGLREVNGKELLCMKMTCDIQGETFKYYNYYYSGDWGILQFIVFTTKAHYDKNLNNIEGILSGLYVE